MPIKNSLHINLSRIIMDILPNEEEYVCSKCTETVWSEWSSWSTTPVTATSTREVETKQVEQ